MAHDKAYREAEEKIEEARRSGETKLDLSADWTVDNEEKLNRLPESLDQLTQLQSLDLSGNQLTAIPEWLGNLMQLQSLDLSDNQLTVLPEALGQLTNLVHLKLGSSNRPLAPGDSNHLKELPVEIVNLQKLKHLSMNGNEFTNLPQHIFRLSSLIRLSAYGNRVSAIPGDLQSLANLEYLNLNDNEVTDLPKEILELKNLKELAIGHNHLTRSSFRVICKLDQLTGLYIQETPFGTLPKEIGYLTNLKRLSVWGCGLPSLPASLAQLQHLEELSLAENSLTDLPPALAQLEHLKKLSLDGNPLNPELAAAYEEGLDAVKAYLRARAEEQILLNEAKLILVGEGEVGKSSLLGALRGDPWVEGLPTTHGIEIKPVKVTDPDSGTEIILNGWDFGGQHVYRPTHQLFFSSPAVYLVVWKPREGPQQGFIKEWIKLVKHREPDAKILVVATHGGPQQRQPDIDRQELWDLFGKEIVIDFCHVESKPDENGERRDIEELKRAIAHVASTLPEMGRSVPKRWQDVREALTETGAAYLPLARVLGLCRDHHMDDNEAHLFVTISHRLGHLIHYEHDPALSDIVVLKPDWLATAISFVLDDEATRKANGLVRFSRLSQLWDDPTRTAEFRYPAALHGIFLRLMERFDLSYRVAGLSPKADADPASLIAQLVPDTRPEKALAREWPPAVAAGDVQQVQICRIVDAQNGQSATAEGLFYQLIVRLHKYSLGRMHYHDSVHWQRGLVLDDEYNGRALLEHIGNDMRITVRAPYPERFLAMLTGEIKYLVESFWEGLRCDVMVPCIEPCGKHQPGTGLFEVEKLITFKRQEMRLFPCLVSGCNQAQDIDLLLRNAPAIRLQPVEILLNEYAEIQRELTSIRHLLVQYGDKTLVRFDRLDARTRRILSRVDDVYAGIMQALTDEAKEGPRLFSLVPVNRSAFNPKQWASSKFHLILWCEHSRLPLPILNGKNSRKGIYEIELTRDWFKNAAPFLKVITGTLSLVLPVASSAVKLALDEATYKSLENYLNFGKDVIDASLSGNEKIGEWMGKGDSVDLPHGVAIRAQGGTLREFHALLKAKDPSFGGLAKVRNKRQEFLWVHPQFEKEY